MILRPHSASTARPYIKHAAHERLAVIPYVKGRLVFADLAVRAMREGGFDRVLLDLPAFLTLGGLAERAVACFPAVSSLVVQNVEGRYVTVPFAPSDAACAALAAVKLLDLEQRPVVDFVDESQIVNYPEYLDQRTARLQDDYTVFDLGLAAYFRDAWDQLDREWDRLDPDQRFFLSHRAGRVAERVTRSLSASTNALLVCDYRLWHLVSRAWSEGARPPRVHVTARWRRLHGALVMEDPYRVWAFGGLDDYPSLVEQFYYSIKLLPTRPFDKLQALNDFMRSSLSGHDTKPSPRRLVAFRQYLEHRMAAEARLVPYPISHLYDAAKSCAGEAFADELARRFLRYPSARMDTIADSLGITEHATVPGSGTFDLPDLEDRPNLYGASWQSADPYYGTELQNLVQRVRPALTRRERVQLAGDMGGVTWELEHEYALHERMCAMLRDMIRAQASTPTIARRWSFRRIHMKRTMRSQARRENRLYVRVTTCRLSDHPRASLHEGTPTVFIFDERAPDLFATVVHDSNLTRRRIELGEQPGAATGAPPDAVYSVYAPHARRETLCDGHITRHHLSSLAMLYSKFMGVERYACIVRNPKRFQCRVDPRGDPDLRDFSGAALGVAWAGKYAERQVIVVARPGWAPSERLSTWLKGRGVTLITCSLSQFPPAMIDRMKVMHSISTALKKHPMRDRIVSRFCQ